MFLGVDIKGILASVVGPRVDNLIFYKSFRYSRTVGALTKGRNVEVEPHTCRGYVAKRNEYDAFGTLIERDDKKIVIYKGTFDTDVTVDVNDYVTDSSGKWYTIVKVDDDSSDAEYVLFARETVAKTVQIRVTITNNVLWNVG